LVDRVARSFEAGCQSRSRARSAFDASSMFVYLPREKARFHSFPASRLASRINAKRKRKESTKRRSSGSRKIVSRVNNETLARFLSLRAHSRSIDRVCRQIDTRDVSRGDLSPVFSSSFSPCTLRQMSPSRSFFFSRAMLAVRDRQRSQPRRGGGSVELRREELCSRKAAEKRSGGRTA